MNAPLSLAPNGRKSQKPRRSMNRDKRNEAMWGHLFTAPLAIGLLLFLAAPLGYAFYISLTEYDLFNAPKFVGMANYQKIFSSYGDEFWESVKNAFIFSIGVLISAVLALIVADLLCRVIHKKAMPILESIFFIPTICSGVAVAIAWNRMYDYMYGTINTLGKIFFHLDPVAWMDKEHAVGSIMFMSVLMGFGTSMLLYISSINSVPDSYYEAAEIDGANHFQQFLHITLPQVSPITFYILVTGIIGSLQGFTTYQVMTNGNPSNTMMPVLLIYKYSGGEYGSFYGYASAMAVVLGGIIIALTVFQYALSKKWVYYES